MPQALLPLVMNILVALMFVGGFLAIAFANPSIAKARWFAIAWLLGLLEPLAALAIWFGTDEAIFRVLAYVGFLSGLLGMGLAISHFYGRRPKWRVAGAILLAGTVFRVATLAIPYGGLYHFGFQMWPALAAALCAHVTRRHAPSCVASRLFYYTLVASAVHFPLKALAATLLGVGQSERDYLTTFYAVVSQTSSGVLLIAAGLLLLVGLLQTLVQSSNDEARCDPLTALPNRRAMEEWLARLDTDRFARAAPPWIALIDIDHFKSFNDRYGHETGDEVLREVAECLDAARPSSARLARIGGEEFFLLLPHRTQSDAELVCEELRRSVAALELDEGMSITVSIGVTPWSAAGTQSDTLRRADSALYRAKSAGRNRSEIAHLGAPSTMGEVRHARLGLAANG